MGCDPLRERYTIASWPWETQHCLDAWISLFDVPDELWPSSQFTAAALTEPPVYPGKPLQAVEGQE